MILDKFLSYICKVPLKIFVIYSVKQDQCGVTYHVFTKSWKAHESYTVANLYMCDIFAKVNDLSDALKVRNKQKHKVKRKNEYLLLSLCD